MPIGLPSRREPGGRRADREARRRLGRRGVCVFSPPVRESLSAATYREALGINREAGGGISVQCFGLFPALRELDDWMREDPSRRDWVKEVHPELSFMAMNGGRPMEQSKHTPEGIRCRISLLDEALFLPRCGRRMEEVLGPLPAAWREHVVDACAALWSALRIVEGTAERLPPEEERDSCGLPMEIWY
ncbi:NUDIX hydrolase [Spirochaeta thermophila DSM 6192]|uniref:NUDIX hydrolase n=2 Tax=Winmispira thermophila TaxID=154 RepID=E0RSV2_WINT6|nr:NUDIX hydrolase [Spirochaeta thermophila DSM 6192]